MTLAKTIEHALRSALQTHARPMYGTASRVAPATGPGQPVLLSGYFYIESLCRDVAAAVEVTHGAQITKEIASA
jgi:hypothetical protein